MKQIEHYIQDACELLAVAHMQERAEQLGLSTAQSSRERRLEFDEYVLERGLKNSDFDAYPQYVANIERHIATFVDRLASQTKARRLSFVCTERESRNNSMKGDFAITIDNSKTRSVSLKNYRNSISRPQVSAGTFNSFALSFLLVPAPGVGMYYQPGDNSQFRGSNRSDRERALRRLGKEWATVYLNELDLLNDEIKQKFVYSSEFEYLDEQRFDTERKRVGATGAKIVFDLLMNIPLENVRKQIVDRIGFSGKEEQLLFDPARYTDSITVPQFRNLIEGVRSTAEFGFGIRGQGIAFEFTSSDQPLLSIHVPFTINKNGAWISETYEGLRHHAKEGMKLASGQRRPKKSKELATSVNTYVDLESTGIFIEA